MGSKIPPFLLQKEQHKILPDLSGSPGVPAIDRTVSNAAKSLKTMYIQAESAGNSRTGNDLNPIIKVVSFIYILVIISLVSSIVSQLLLGCLIFLLFVFSGIRISGVYKKILLPAFLFGFLVSVPASLNVITPGDMFYTIFSLEKSYNFWIYHIPGEIGITIQGCKIVARLFLRVFNSVSLSLLLVYSTSFPRMLKAFGVLHIPDTLLMVIWLAYKFIFILCKTVEETFMAVKSRFIGNVKNQVLRTIVAGRLYFLYNKSLLTYEQTYSAMISRGYEGKIILVAENRLRGKDLLILLGVLVIGALFLFL